MPSNSNKYLSLWKSYMLPIFIKLNNGETSFYFNLQKKQFTSSSGSRINYSFSLEYLNGEKITNNSGSAVARDLHSTLSQSADIMSKLKIGHYKFTLDNNFTFHIQKLT